MKKQFQRVKNSKAYKKVEFFWDYYKWAVIIPLLVVVIIISLVSSYLYDKRDMALCVALMNTSDVNDAIYAFKHEYPAKRGTDIKGLPIEVEYNFLHPKVMDEAAAADTTTVASIQKYQAMLLNSKIDVTITTPWVIEQYGEADACCDLRTLVDETYLDQLGDLVLYCKNSSDDLIPVGICVDDNELLGEFYEDGVPYATVSAYSSRKEEAALFIKWLSKDSAN